jgi:hypothetical protein
MGCKVYKIKIAIAKPLENNFISFVGVELEGSLPFYAPKR